jgi:hypothetical protein
METPAVATQTKLFVITMAASVCDSVTNYQVDTSIFRMGRDSSVCIATRYELDSLEIESRWARDFWHLSRQVLRLIQPPVEWILGLFPGGKAAGVRR